MTRPNYKVILLLLLMTGVLGSSTATTAAAEDKAQSPPVTVRDQPQRRPGLLPAWQKLKTAPILHYCWHPASVMREDLFKEYIEMGFTGIFYDDHDPPHGGKLFVDRGLHGRMPQAGYFHAGVPIRLADGKDLKGEHPWIGSVFAPKNIVAYQEHLVRFIKKYGHENLFKIGDSILMSNWDETGLFSRKYMEYGTGVPEQ